MQIRETIDNPSTASTECPPEDVIFLVDSTGVAFGVQHAFSAKVLTRLRSQSGMASDRGFRRTKAVAGSQRANSRTGPSLRIIVPPLWMTELNLRSIEPLVTIPLVLVHPKCTQAKRRKQCLTAWKVTGLTRSCDAQSVRASLVSSGIIRGERRFAPGSVSIASRRAAKVTTIGWAGSKSPSTSRPENRARAS
jgi:hypothetical protein